MTAARRGRPMGELGRSVLAFARETQLVVTSLDCARYLQMPRSVAADTLRRLRDAGHMREVGEIQQAGARRPLKLCEPVPLSAVSAGDAGAASECVTPTLLVLTWPRRG